MVNAYIVKRKCPNSMCDFGGERDVSYIWCPTCGTNLESKSEEESQ